jgi:hypothetical protein
MKTFYFFLFITSFSLAQPFQIGTLNVDFVDSSRNNRVVNTRIYYPANTAGNNVPVTTLTAEQFPVLTFGHGFLMAWSAYANIWEAMVPQGYIMAFPTTEGGISPSHLEFARDLVFVNNTIKDLGTNPTSIFNTRVHPRSGVMGHSMGGGAAHIAATLSTNINALLSLSAAITNPSPISSSASINIPTLLITGTNDCVTVPQNTQIPIYNAITNSPCKSFVSITGGSHCQMANFNFNCNLGDSTCTPAPTITREFQHQVLNQFMSLWLDGFLKQICQSHLTFLQTMSQSPAITFQNSCEPCALSASSLMADELTIYPNPTAGEFVIDKITFQNITFFDLSGKNYELLSTEGGKINISQFSPGIYFIKITTIDNKTIIKKLIKK